MNINDLSQLSIEAGEELDKYPTMPGYPILKFIIIALMFIARK